jgi:hypothetical protein
VAKVSRENVVKELARQRVTEGAVPAEGILDALAQTATGALKMSLKSPLASESKIREQTIAHIVHAYLRPSDPRDVHASMMPKIVKDLFVQRGFPKPGADAVAAVSEVAIGFLREGDRALPAIARLMAAHSAVSFYLNGV